MPIHVVFDNPPLEMDDWVKEVCDKTGLALVENKAISKAMARDEESKKVLVTPGLNPYGADRPKMAPLYRKALEQLHGGAQRRGLYSSAWLEYLEDVDAYVLDWSEIDKRAKEMDKDNAAFFRDTNTKALRERIKANISPGKVLELKGGLSREERVKQAVEFIKLLES